VLISPKPDETHYVQDKPRKAPRTRRGQLLTLLNGWDPAGLLQAGASRDEYDSIVDSLLSLLSRNAGKAEVAAFLQREVSEKFGKAPPDASQFAAKAVAWFQIASRENE
jgi:hypothetical protein